MSRIGVFGALALGVAWLVLVPDTAEACAVCFDSSDENRQAFLATTAFLTILPLGMVTGAGLWLRRRARQLEEEVGTSEPLED
ncbi:MAG TPA: hypothetical protein VLA09_13580 [Longimicrobiales bacterium]|nr:hypothetical protein [Longimicrobiales bacterium]